MLSQPVEIDLIMLLLFILEYVGVLRVGEALRSVRLMFDLTLKAFKHFLYYAGNLTVYGRSRE
ncbi:hypothetical protein DQQ10_22355 [Pseudochryseolinea flava]|uniref:Uncharacterized protein n=2 Tax=Pseudochryseolinea flava TaxID=2059302 RepID=A0A364XY84_9BACT|nr:hypothetical protein DQQ10_22355 [Pseudochryseolinea flava]